jgi:hypothetical protein
MNDKTDIRWLAVGALAGLVAAGYGILQQSSPATELPDAAIAMVNDQAIGRDIYERALVRFGTPDPDDAGSAILGRLIDDELLVQRGIELGMTESDTEVRAAIVNSLVASITAEADAASPTDEELEQHLADHADRFSYTSRLSVEAWESDLEPVAQAFASALRTDGTAPQMAAISALPDLPADLLPVDTVREYLGPAITAAAAEMPDGSSAVFARRGRWLVVRVDGKERAYVTDVDAVRNRVLLDYRRQLAEDMLQSYIDNLRQRADIRVAQP